MISYSSVSSLFKVASFCNISRTLVEPEISKTGLSLSFVSCAKVDKNLVSIPPDRILDSIKSRAIFLSEVSSLICSRVNSSDLTWIKLKEICPMNQLILLIIVKTIVTISLDSIEDSDSSKSESSSWSGVPLSFLLFCFKRSVNLVKFSTSFKLDLETTAQIVIYS